MFRVSTIVILFSISLYSCSKENNSQPTTINITVENVFNGEAVDSILFYLYGKRTSFPIRTHQIGQEYPINGSLTFSFISRRGHEYYISEIDPTPTFCILGVEGAPFEIGLENELNYKVSTYNELVISIENVNCFNSFDTLHWRLDYLTYPEYSFENIYWEDFGWNGCYGKENAIDSYYPTGDYSFEWVVKRENADSIYGTEYFKLPENESLVYDFQY
jgi:hypothetical protein